MDRLIVFVMALVVSITIVYAQQAQSVAQEHPDDVVRIFVYILGGMGAALMLMATLLYRNLLGRLDRIESAVHEGNDDISGIRAKVQEVDARLTKAETEIALEFKRDRRQHNLMADN